MPETFSTDSQTCLLKCIVILNDKDITLNAYERTELTISDVKIDVQLYSVPEVITNLRGNNFNVYLNY